MATNQNIASSIMFKECVVAIKGVIIPNIISDGHHHGRTLLHANSETSQSPYSWREKRQSAFTNEPNAELK